MRCISLFLLLLACYFTVSASQQRSAASKGIEELTDIKDFKKLLRTKNNILVLFISSLKAGDTTVRIFKDAASTVRGQGTMVLVDCSGEGKKMCKKLKVSPEPITLKHYKNGEFHKDYDRKMTVQSMVSFMKDPSGDAPWEEDDTATDVKHLESPESLVRLIKKETRPLLVLFYAPWCGFCKQLKPHYADAARELKDEAVMAAIDVDRPENNVVRHQFNISAFPTLLYFKNGRMQFAYEGANKKNDLVAFMRDPSESARKEREKPKEEPWSATPSDVVHLTADDFDSFIQEEQTVLVMFYAPWCGHCKRMKPDYEKAARMMVDQKIPGKLAAVDATVEQSLAKKFKVQGYPTVKLFHEGQFKFDANVRDVERIITLMKDPTKPPPVPEEEKPWSAVPSEVIHLTTESYKQILKKKRHALVMYYAPWCGHCKNLKPHYQDAAQVFEDEPQVTFAALDCTEHGEVCKFAGVSGYPTLKYYHYYNKGQSDYNGGRTKEDLVKFMRNPPEVAKDEL
ncbi:Protein disulfide-isomerase A5 [Frankliniella fusca]|uniref:Protein disulfide-isomerase A5 n=1 Tax=Frankliniella fusca TaxID=407009 RepID=A0AAE1I0A0_9NEOP|nr:Protein disulfide-isomerase A5 [Frankliniella fusca]